MSKDFITFDFKSNTIRVEHDGEQGTIEMPDLAAKRSAIYAAAGIEQVDGDELRADIRALFQALGLDATV